MVEVLLGIYFQILYYSLAELSISFLVECNVNPS